MHIVDQVFLENIHGGQMPPMQARNPDIAAFSMLGISGLTAITGGLLAALCSQVLNGAPITRSSYQAAAFGAILGGVIGLISVYSIVEFRAG